MGHILCGAIAGQLSGERSRDTGAADICRSPFLTGFIHSQGMTNVLGIFAFMNYNFAGNPICRQLCKQNISMNKRNIFIRHIALPQDHGSWVFLISPLLIGLFAGGNFSSASVYLIIAAMAGFLIRQPITIATKAYSGRRSRADLPAARFWILVYAVIGALAIAGVLLQGFGYLLYLVLPGLLVFIWYLSLVRKRAERRKIGVAIVASGVLALAAPAAYWIGRGYPDPLGCAICVLNRLRLSTPRTSSI